jgi:4-aminobutyrate aminotransferase-like enzyme
MQRLRERTAGRGVASVHGRGLIVGLAFDGGESQALLVMRQLLGRGWIVLTGGALGDVVTLTPPLDIEESLLDAFTDTLVDVLGG